MESNKSIFRKLLLLTVLILSGFTLRAQEDSVKIEYPVMDYSNPKQYVINSIKVTGVKFLDTDVLIATSGLIKGDTITIPGNAISDAVNRLWIQRYFSDVKVIVGLDGDKANLEIKLQERPRVYNWNFTGVSKGNITEITERLKLRRGVELSDYTINTSKGIIKKYYEEKGFRNANTEIKIANDTTVNNAVNVTFVINKGRKVKIGAIDFEGNTIFSDRKLRGAFKKTNQKSINIFKSTKFKEAEYLEDKENLIDFYNSKGYRNSIIVSDSIYKIDDKHIGIKLNIEEGNKYYFRNIKWLGNSTYDTQYLNALLGIMSGDMYDRKTMYKRLGKGKDSNPDDQSVTSLYQNNGYLFFQIEPEETIIGKDSIDLEIKIVEGKQATINDVLITGNNRINDHVIRRELYVRPGELYNRAVLMNTIRQLAQMNHFNAEALQPDIKPVGNELVNIIFPLQEQPSDKFEISGGWGANMFVGSIGIELNNLSISEVFKKRAWRPYPSGDNQQLKLRAQTNGSYYKAFSLNFTEPWLGGKKPTSLSVGLFYTDETDAYYVWQTGNKHFKTIGASVGLGRRLKWPDPNFQIYTELGYQSYNLKDWDNFIMKNGSSNIITLKTVFSRNTVDQPIFPRTGSEFSLSITLTPPYSLFDNKNYGDPTMPDHIRYNLIEFHKWQFKMDWYYPLIGNNLILRASAQMGFLGSYNKNKISPFEGFEVGGDGMSGYNVYGVEIIGLRGYENGSLTPSSFKGDYGRAYNKYTMELRYPFILQPSSQIYGLVFAEGGNAFKDIKTFNPFTIKRSLGVGVRMYLPIVGMMGIDWGYGFDRIQSTGKRGGSQFHFMIGMPF